MKRLAAACVLWAGGLAAAAGTPATPSARDVLRQALQLRDVPLTIDESCRDAGPDAADRTIGDYLAGFLAAMDRPSNTVETACEPRPGGRARCRLWLKHRDDEDRWAWGLEFDLDARGRADRRSVRCIGAG